MKISKTKLLNNRPKFYSGQLEQNKLNTYKQYGNVYDDSTTNGANYEVDQEVFKENVTVITGGQIIDK